MITKNPMQFKALMKNKAKELKVTAQMVMQNYMLERLLERLSRSKYKDQFIIKGGFLLSSVIGLSSRTTMDLDTTIKGFTLNHDQLRVIFTEICSMESDDDITFDLVNIADIRETDDYPGLRVSLKANYIPISVPLTVDVTTGDIITPAEIKYVINSLFTNEPIEVWAYNIETLLAEKIETVLSRDILNTRARDYYDIYILYHQKWEYINIKVLKEALQKTTIKRQSQHILDNPIEIINRIEGNKELVNLWIKYQKSVNYTDGIKFIDTCSALRNILAEIIL